MELVNVRQVLCTYQNYIWGHFLACQLAISEHKSVFSNKKFLKYVCMYVCMYVCVHMCIYVCMYVCTCECVSVHVCMDEWMDG